MSKKPDTNFVHLTGRLGADAELKQTSAGPVCQLRMATTSEWKGEEKTAWHSVVIWGAQAEPLGNLRKGCPVMVTGELRTRSWEKDGVKQYKTEVNATYAAAIQYEQRQQQTPAPMARGNNNNANAFNDADTPF